MFLLTIAIVRRIDLYCHCLFILSFKQVKVKNTNILNLLTWGVIDSILKAWEKNSMLPGLAIPGFIMEIKSEYYKQISHSAYSGFAYITV